MTKENEREASRGKRSIVLSNLRRRPESYLPLQLRQKLINDRVISFASDFIPVGATMYDPFAGLGAGLQIC